MGSNGSYPVRRYYDEHVERDIRFLRAAGVHIKDQVVERSVTAEHHKRLASGIAVPTRTGNQVCRPIPVG